MNVYRLKVLKIILVALALCFCCIGADYLHALDLYISNDGNDTWSGRLPDPDENSEDGPFATFRRGREEVRKYNGDEAVNVYVRDGIYYFSASFALDGEDSGGENTPVMWCSYPGERAHLMAGSYINDFRPVMDEDVLDRLHEDSRSNVVQANLFDAGITDLKGITQSGGPGMELYFDSKPMTLARYPDNDWLTIVSVPLDCENPIDGDVTRINEDGTSRGMHCGKFVYADADYQVSQPKTWAQRDDIWMFGYWCWDWSSMFVNVDYFDHDNDAVYYKPPYHKYGYLAGQRYYFLNVLEELDSPGEWYVDYDSGILYFWPPSPIGENDVFISAMDEDIWSISDASFITVKDFLFEGTRNRSLTLTGCTNTVIEGCEVRNVGGQYAILLNGGTENGVINCWIHDVAGGGITLAEGDRTSLAPGNSYAINNKINDFARVYTTYRSGILVEGVGNRIAHNEIYNAPHAGFIFHGNDHVIEYNKLYNYALETHDVGGIYNGRDFSQRGTVIRYNFLYESPNAFGIYFDDFLSGNTVYGNIVYNNKIGVIIGGGRSNIIENNMFIDCSYANINVDGRGLNWNSKYFDTGAANYDSWMIDRLNDMNYTEPPYSTAYPELPGLYGDEPAAPKYNVIRRNILYGGTAWVIESAIDSLVARENNLVDIDPLFVDYEGRNFQLQESSPAFSEIGFEKIPFEKIGLLGDDNQTEIQEQKPYGFEVEQNRPNPFNPMTVIAFNLSRADRVTITIYNTLGQKVMTLLDDYRAAGNTSVTFDGSRLSSGLYFYRIKCGENVVTKKMLLMK